MITSNFHRWSNGRQLSDPPKEAICTLLQTIHAKFKSTLPTVDIDKGFIVRRQTRRSLASTSLQHILKSLPNLFLV
jgi:hypothetical protein